ncbi:MULTISPECIES: outer membrane lipoprotein chaperone LolA [unclassified Agarivorans]|uniref:outer membrane lipoprotein chaperone LolA n=1 Tax=unclassified Agarivorans TaxID=2636026 RepID=UPI0026E2B406|nr:MULTISPECIES: outer membrane lipoprotein chaperone LolA [unclassified Agarivorans]MDO6684986.1 outer membrane lipoprotein chaperone LolA [Agarivorans sp. 3_MG-2023]MDO6714853.1 outer membrane lipoprotein chaperone LolA [Agarivorans sp. 2_MG-2023]MDO6765368.1 outer membrane lipoprotein chaperone LolA [Agarivorans sp. 1_MG-2023]
MKTLVSIAFAALVSGQAVAADAAAELKQHLADLQGFQAQFKQTVIDADGVNIHEAEGKLSLARPAKLNWQQVMPEQDMIVSDGSTIWYYSPFVEQVTIMDAGEAINQSPFILLADDRKESWQNYQVEKLEQGYLVKSKQDPMQAAFWVKLNADSSISRFDIIESTGQRSEFTLDSFKANPKFDSKLFQFDIPANTMIDDQR